MNLLLLSNSSTYGKEYFSFAGPIISKYLNERAISEVVFIPFASSGSLDDYTKNVSNKLGGINVKGIHSFGNKVQAIVNAQAIMIGGGNTFLLLKRLQEEGLLEPIRQKVLNNTPYIGWSAGSNMACPTIKTTNDMPIVQPSGFDALNLMPFQINPHYTEKVIEGHNGESRAQRLKEFLEMNQKMGVMGLPEEGYITVNDNKYDFFGKENSKWMRFSQDILNIENNTNFTQLINI